MASDDDFYRSLAALTRAQIFAEERQRGLRPIHDFEVLGSAEIVVERAPTRGVMPHAPLVGVSCWCD